MGYTRLKMNFGNQIILAILAVIGISIATYHSPVFNEFPKNYTTTNFPLIKQPDQITCGPTSALMLLKYYGQDNYQLNDVKIQSKTHWFNYNGNPIGMTAPDVLTSALNRLGLSCKMIQGNMSKLKYFVSQNRLPIVLLRSGEYTWHYVVVIGYNQEIISIADPGWGKISKLKEDYFEKSWEFTSHMDGKEATDKIVSGVLRLAEVHPFTMIVPEQIPTA